MDDLLKMIEKHIGKAIGIPFALNGIQFLLMLLHATSDGVIDHEELEGLLQAGSGIQMVLLAGVMAYLKLKRNK
jgi:hypothetical protein